MQVMHVVQLLVTKQLLFLLAWNGYRRLLYTTLYHRWLGYVETSSGDRGDVSSLRIQTLHFRGGAGIL